MTSTEEDKLPENDWAEQYNQFLHILWEKVPVWYKNLRKEETGNVILHVEGEISNWMDWCNDHTTR